jgi:hypothetical protein
MLKIRSPKSYRILPFGNDLIKFMGLAGRVIAPVYFNPYFCSGFIAVIFRYAQPSSDKFTG